MAPTFEAERVPLPKLEPFLKWAGGKRWLMNHYSQVLPRTYSRYVEPFLGSGAVFFRLQPESAILSDSNAELIETYQAIRDEWELVCRHLKVHQVNHSRAYYYLMREHVPRTRATRAARFIYLNRTCWNGLYRVNRRGEFNVPIGTKTAVLMGQDDFRGVALLLSRCQIECSDFEAIIDQTRRGDVVYVDPPYTINHGNNGFVKYNDRLFQWQDQVRLRDAVLRAMRRGAHVIVSNAYHPCIRDLYERDFQLSIVSRFSRISGSSRGRVRGQEYLITGV